MHKKNLGEIEDYLNPAEDWEAREETEGSSKKSKLILQAVLHVSFNLVVGRSVKIDVKHVQLSVLLSSNLKKHLISKFASFEATLVWNYDQLTESASHRGEV